MSGKKKIKEELLHPVITSMTDKMNAVLSGIAADNNTSRNDVIRIACQYLIDNKKKFKLK